MGKFEREFIRSFDSLFKKYDFNSKGLDEDGRFTYLKYTRLKKEVKQFIEIKHETGLLSSVEIRVSFNEKSGGLFDERRYHSYFYGSGAKYMKASDDSINIININRSYHPNKNACELIPIISAYLDEALQKMDSILDEYIIRESWEEELSILFDEYVEKDEEMPFETIDEMAVQFERMVEEAGELSQEEFKQLLLKLSVIYGAYLIKNYSFFGAKFSIGGRHQFYIDLNTNEKVKVRPISVVYQMYMTRDYYRSLSKSVYYSVNENKEIKLNDYTDEKKFCRPPKF